MCCPLTHRTKLWQWGGGDRGGGATSDGSGECNGGRAVVINLGLCKLWQV